MIAEYVFKTGFSLYRFWALFSQPSNLDNLYNCTVNGQFIYCIATSPEKAQEMIIAHYKTMDIECKSVELTQPITTKNSDLKHLYKPSDVLGYDGAVVAKTESAKEVLQLMDTEEDGEVRYSEFVKSVAQKHNINIPELEAMLEPFV